MLRRHARPLRPPSRHLLHPNGYYAWMVSMELALAHRQCSKKYVAEEETARVVRRGMHQGTFVPPWD